MKKLIKKFTDIHLQDIPMVGGKNASLGEMYNELTREGIKVPDGFAVTAEAFRMFLTENNLNSPLAELMAAVKRPDYSNLSLFGSKARELIRDGKFSDKLSADITEAYSELGEGMDIA